MTIDSLIWRTNIAMAALLLAVVAGCGGGSAEGTTSGASDSAASGGNPGIDTTPGPQPHVQSVSGSALDGQTLTLQGRNFTAKVNPQPLLVWSADGGTQPSALGRKTAWDGSFSGEVVDRGTTGAVVAPGSLKALRHDYGTRESAILARVSFQSDQLYVWRKRFDDFDRATDYAIRTRYTAGKALQPGASPKVGMLMSTADKRIWGKIIQQNGNGAGAGVGTAFYSNTVGNVTDKSLARSVVTGELLNFYDETDTAMKTPIYQAQLQEGQGVYHTFNHKIFRLWGQYGVDQHNTYLSLDRDGTLVSESTQVDTLWMPLWDRPMASAKRRWATEEFQYQTGTVDQVDGQLQFWQDRVQGVSTQRFRFGTATFPNRYADLYQTQVSNGAQPLSYEYFDTLYVDDTWHRVLMCDQASWAACTRPEVQIPTAWSDTQIRVSIRKGSLTGASPLYVYVVNGRGEINAQGMRVN